MDTGHALLPTKAGRTAIPPDPATGRPAGYIDAVATPEGLSFHISPELAGWMVDHADLNALAEGGGGARALSLRAADAGLGALLGPLLEVNNAALYHQLRTILAKGKTAFTTPAEGLWPTADLTTRGQTLKAVAQLKPDPVQIEPYLTGTETAAWQERMAQTVMALDDVTADVLDVISAIWIKQAAHPEAMATITADDFLRLRGLRPHKGGAGRRGGYKAEWRREIGRHIAALANTWVKVFEMEVTEEAEGGRGPRRRRTTWQGESKAVVVSSRFGQFDLSGQLDTFAWRARPGDVFARFLFGPGRQTALLSLKALEYDPYRQRWEKRLARYVAWQWRTRRGESARMTISTLLEAIGETPSRHNPTTTKERLEQALDTLRDDGVIGGWQYEAGADEAIVGGKGWVTLWLAWTATITPPQPITEQYAGIRPPIEGTARVLPSPSPTPPAGVALGDQVKAARRARGLTQKQAAAQIGITQSWLSRIERGLAPAEEGHRQIAAWLASPEREESSG